MKIIADTATLLSPTEGESLGMTIIPVCVIINNQSYKDYAEISSAEFLQMVADGGIPTSSQPALGDVLDVLEADEEEAIFLTVGDGLSGAYQTAMGARGCMEKNDHIHIVNSKTLAGPLRYLARKAVSLKDQGFTTQQILSELDTCIESSASFVIPADFEFLKRSGRLTPIAAKIGGVLKLLPILTQTEDKTRIKPVTVKRSWKSALEVIIQRLQAMGINEEYLISVSHAGTPDRAIAARDQIQAAFPDSEIEILELSPALITHGGPGCIVVQVVRR